MTEIRPVEGGPHDEVHTAVKALLARRPYTAELDALVTLLHRLTDRHQVPVGADIWDRRCSCGARIDLEGDPCPEMEPVLDLAAAVIADDRRELVHLRITAPGPSTYSDPTARDAEPYKWGGGA